MSHSDSDFAALLLENEQLRERIRQLELNASATSASSGTLSHNVQPRSTNEEPHSNTSPLVSTSTSSSWQHKLTPTDIQRYSRQIILSDFGGADTQRKLLNSSVLIVGAGGLGAPVALYLAAAGVGHLIIVDGDRVEMSNLHRQVIHTEARIGQFKADSARESCLALNSSITVESVTERFTEVNAIELAQRVDVVIDASDNVATRYLCNDAAIACGKVLVSGSALRMEGQVSVFGLHGGPCYRCLYPKPPPPETVTNCSDGGVLGAVTGVIGSIQAMETIKILGGLIAPPDQTSTMELNETSTNFSPAAAAATLSTCNTKLLLFDGSSASFRSVKLRGRNKDCVVCGSNPTITKSTLLDQAIDYQLFCGSANHDAPDAVKRTVTRVPSTSVEEYSKSQSDPALSSRCLLLDVREPVQFRICALPNAVNVPLRVLKRGFPQWLQRILVQDNALTSDDSSSSSSSSPITPTTVQSITPHPTSSVSDVVTFDKPPNNLFVICRRGVDSVTATQLLLAERYRLLRESSTSDSASDSTAAPALNIQNVSGGLQSWTDKVEPSFPLY